MFSDHWQDQFNSPARRTMQPKHRRFLLLLIACGFIVGVGVLLVQVGDAYAQRQAVKGAR